MINTNQMLDAKNREVKRPIVIVVIISSDNNSNDNKSIEITLQGEGGQCITSMMNLLHHAVRT